MRSVNFDVVIIGTGIAGISTAYYLATQHNITNILLVDKRPPMTYTSDKSGSNYRNWWSHPAMMQLANHSISLMDDLAKQTHNIFNMNRRGYAYFSRDKDILPSLKHYNNPDMGDIRVHESTQNTYQPNENLSLIGADVLIGNNLIKQCAPFVSDDIESMIHVRRAGWISTRVMAQHMLDTATQLGLLELRGELTNIEFGNNATTVTIETQQGEQHINTPKLLLALGPDIASQKNILGQDIPLDNVFHQKIMLCDEGEVIPSNMPFMIFRDAPTADFSSSEHDYLKQHTGTDDIPGNFHIRRVNPRWIHVGWAFNRQSSSTLEGAHFEELFPKVVLKGISSFIPTLAPYAEHIPQPIQISGGFYTRTPENLPIIQETTHKGLYVIGALSGFGVMMGCGAGEIMSRLITEKDIPDYTNQFSVSRYDAPDYQQAMLNYGSGEL